jgi:hypothetical protein
VVDSRAGLIPATKKRTQQTGLRPARGSGAPAPANGGSRRAHFQRDARSPCEDARSIRPFAPHRSPDRRPDRVEFPPEEDDGPASELRFWSADTRSAYPGRLFKVSMDGKALGGYRTLWSPAWGVLRCSPTRLPFGERSDHPARRGTGSVTESNSGGNVLGIRSGHAGERRVRSTLPLHNSRWRFLWIDLGI